MDDFQVSLPVAVLQDVAKGVAAATQCPADVFDQVIAWILQHVPDHLAEVTVREWRSQVDLEAAGLSEDVKQMMYITLGVALLREKSRRSKQVTPSDLDFALDLFHDSLATPKDIRLKHKAFRSAQGHLAVPLSSVIVEGKIVELFRLHVWLPDEQRGRPEVAIHSHQPYSVSWNLAGQSTADRYLVNSTNDLHNATHAEYVPQWSDGGDQSNATYKTHQVSSTLAATGGLVRAQKNGSSKHLRDQEFTLSPGEYHANIVAGNQFYATLFYFDATRGFLQHAGVLGPVGGGDFAQLRDPGEATASCLAQITKAARAWETSRSRSSDSRGDESMIEAYYKLFLGRVLYEAGRKDDAVKLFDSESPCPPIVCFAKEPSTVHRQYIAELVQAGVDLDVTDSTGYKALDYAILHEDTSTEAIVVDGYRRRFDTDVVADQISRREYEAMIRKAYYSLFEEKIRPILHSGRKDTLQVMRQTYATALANDEATRNKFDGLRYLWYSDFINSPRLPRYMDGRVNDFAANQDGAGSDNAEYIIFLSYRWIHKDPVTGKTAPDNKSHTQFRRMRRALELFLDLHPEINRAKLGIWLDSVSINRRAPMPGISALPINIAQCDALITISDEQYWSRAWCSVEALMFQILRASYPHYLFYEFLPPNNDDGEAEENSWELKEAPLDKEIDISKTAMTWEEDRAKIQFLERQARLLAA